MLPLKYNHLLMHFQDLNQRNIFLQSAQTCLARALVYGKSKCIFVFLWKGWDLGGRPHRRWRLQLSTQQAGFVQPYLISWSKQKLELRRDSGWHADKGKQSALLKASSRVYLNSALGSEGPGLCRRKPSFPCALHWLLCGHCRSHSWMPAHH